VIKEKVILIKETDPHAIGLLKLKLELFLKYISLPKRKELTLKQL